jgi:large subunit ribosomal protein L17
MQHQRTNRKLGMKTAHRVSVLRNMATSLVMHERVRTTDTRAKEIRRVVERMITLGKKGDLNARRKAAEFIRGNEAVSKLFEDIAPRYKTRAGGYTRIVRIGHRHGDNAPLVVIELVEGEAKKAPAKKAPAKKAAAPKKPAAEKKAAAAEKAEKPAPKKAPRKKKAEAAE